MTVTKQKNGKHLVQINRKGFPRVRKLFADEKQAHIFNRETLADMSAKRDLVTDSRTLIELVRLWYKYHGINLADGERQRTCLITMAKALGNPQACLLTAEQFVDYRYARLMDGITSKTFNNHQSYLSAMFNKLIKLNVIDYANPVAGIDAIKIQERQLTYLSKEQINVLMADIETNCKNKSTWFVAQICIRTGARWGEAEKMLVQQLHSGRITFAQTKSKKTRTVPVSDQFKKKLSKFITGKNPGDRAFTNCIGAFRRAITRTGIDLPKGQCSHILRHSFASHFVINGGDILTLQKILGHSDIHTTLRYAHLAPDHLADAIKFNPLD